jgi:hypothetical protein
LTDFETYVVAPEGLEPPTLDYASAASING